MDISLGYGAIVLAVLVVVLVAKTATVVPQQSAYVVEYLGKYSRTLQAGFHILIPFVDRVSLNLAAELVHRTGDWQARALHHVDDDRRLMTTVAYAL